MEQEIELGDKVKDKVTGFTGIAVAKTEFLNGCVQYSVAAKVGKDNKMPEEIGIDEQSLKVITKNKKPKKEDVGGATKPGIKMRGF